MRELQNLIIFSYAHCWKQIGLGLKLSYAKLQIIEANYTKSEERCIAMLDKWLQKEDGNATWQKLLEVIDSISGRGDDNAGKYRI